MTTTHTPASMIASAHESGALDGVSSFFGGLASAAQNHPLMTGLGIAAVASILYAARHLTYTSNETARKTAAAYAAAQAATAAVRRPGALTSEGIAYAYSVPRGHNYTKTKPAASDRIHPAGQIIADSIFGGMDVSYVDTQMADTMPAPFQR